MSVELIQAGVLPCRFANGYGLMFTPGSLAAPELLLVIL